MVKRKIVEIDEDKCNGCGLCVPNCHEGALQIIEGKAKLVADTYCDGLGNCLGHCPQDAITIVEKDVSSFDFKATNAHLKKIGKEILKDNPLEAEYMKKKISAAASHSHDSGCMCPGSRVMDFDSKPESTSTKSIEQSSELRQWPVQLSLIPPNAAFLQGADLLISADCVSVADPNYQSLLKGKRVVMGCPKLDDVEAYKEKIKTMIEINDFNTITVAIMEVPCCSALYSAVEEALDESGKRITLKKIVIGIDGKARK